MWRPTVAAARRGCSRYGTCDTHAAVSWNVSRCDFAHPLVAAIVLLSLARRFPLCASAASCNMGLARPVWSLRFLQHPGHTLGFTLATSQLCVDLGREINVPR